MIDGKVKKLKAWSAEKAKEHLKNLSGSQEKQQSQPPQRREEKWEVAMSGCNHTHRQCLQSSYQNMLKQGLTLKLAGWRAIMFAEIARKGVLGTV